MHWKSRSRSRSSALAALAWIAVVAGLSPCASESKANDDHACVLVVSADVTVDNLDFDEVRKLFLFRRQFWSPGRPVNLILVESDIAEGSCLLDRIYRTDVAAFRTMIREKIYSSEIDFAPKVVATDVEAIAYAARARGVLTLVRQDSVGDGVRVLKIDGRMPGTSGYPLGR